jgi:hypothetical protein
LVSWAGFIVTSHRFSLAVCLFGCLVLGGASSVAATPAPKSAGRPPLEVDGLRDAIRLSQAQGSPAPASAAPAPSSTTPVATNAASNEPIGNVATLTGVATLIRNKASIALKLRDDIYLNDIVETAASSSVGITFNDATTFHLTANARITIDSYVYDDSGKQNAAIFDIGRGTVAFVAAAVARTGDMKIDTPTASLGIRGTTGLVEVPEGAAGGANNVNIKLYPDADGRVGHIDVSDRAGVRLGTLTQGASGFTIRRGAAGGRFAAVPLTISPQQAARDQGFVRQVHATQSVGRQIVREQRAFRRANPGLNNRGNRPGQPRPNALPGQNRPGQPGTQKGQREPPRPGTPQQHGQQQRPGQNTQPGAPPVTPAPSNEQRRSGTPGGEPRATRPAAQPRQGGLQRGRAPGLQHAQPPRPGFQRRPSPQKKKRP